LAIVDQLAQVHLRSPPDNFGVQKMVYVVHNENLTARFELAEHWQQLSEISLV
jgi:hypothetical protein